MSLKRKKQINKQKKRIISLIDKIFVWNSLTSMSAVYACFYKSTTRINEDYSASHTTRAHSKLVATLAF